MVTALYIETIKIKPHCRSILDHNGCINGIFICVITDECDSCVCLGGGGGDFSLGWCLSWAVRIWLPWTGFIAGQSYCNTAYSQSD